MRQPASVRVGDHVIYVDAFAKPHHALVTIVWSLDYYTKQGKEPGLNLVIIEEDEARQDTYGRQIHRPTSVVHKSEQPAHGYYWMYPDEEQNPVLAPAQT